MNKDQPETAGKSGQVRHIPASEDTLKPVPPEMIPAQRSEEEMQKISEASQKLAEKDNPVQSCCVTLIFARQLYYSALQSLRERMTELKHDPSDGVEAHLVSSMAEAAKKPFQRQMLVNKLQSHTLPWLAATIATEAEESRQKEHREEMSIDEQRRVSDIDLGFRWGASDDPEKTTVSRDRPLILAGNPRAVDFLLGRLVPITDALTKVLRLCNENIIPNLRKSKSLRYREVSLNIWYCKLASFKQTAKVLGLHLRTMHKQAIDLLIIDDITMLMKPIVKGTADVRTAGNALRHVRKWAEEVGCGIVAGLPLAKGMEIPQVGADRDWEQLELYSDLREIQIEEGPYDEDYECETYNLKIANDIAVDRIDRAVIDGEKT